jgi:hypothetical protein
MVVALWIGSAGATPLFWRCRNRNIVEGLEFSPCQKIVDAIMNPKSSIVGGISAVLIVFSLASSGYGENKSSAPSSFESISSEESLFSYVDERTKKSLDSELATFKKQNPHALTVHPIVFNSLVSTGLKGYKGSIRITLPDGTIATYKHSYDSTSVLNSVYWVGESESGERFTVGFTDNGASANGWLSFGGKRFGLSSFAFGKGMLIYDFDPQYRQPSGDDANRLP